MTALFLAPHNDDETLFGAFTLIRHRPHVVVCLESHRQDTRHYPGGPITAATRESETVAAITALGLDPYGHLTDPPGPGLEQWPYPDDLPLSTDTLVAAMKNAAELHEADVVYVPAIENAGHAQHNEIGAIALVAFGDRCRFYLTYTANGRSRGREVEFEPEWVARKLAALACYGSQIRSPATQMWFTDDPIREYAL